MPSIQQRLNQEPDSEGEPETGKIDDSILDLNADDQPTQAGTSYTSPARVSAPTALSPLWMATSGIQAFLQPAMPLPRSTAFLTTLVVISSTIVFFKMLAAVQLTLNQDPVFASVPEPQRLAPLQNPHTQMLKCTLSNRTCK